VQRDSLGVPERGHGIDLARDHLRHRREADRVLLDGTEVAGVARDNRVQHGHVRRQAGHPDGAAGQVARALDAGLRDHGGERLLHQRADRDDVGPALRRQPEIVDVEHAHVRAPGRHELQRVRRAGPRAEYAQLHAVPAVGARPHGRVDGRMRRIRREVERERERFGTARVVGAATARRDRDEQGQQGQAEPHRQRS
jgi:hypothetical protein